MRVTQAMVDALMKTTGVDAMTAGAALNQLAEIISPIPADVLAVRDRRGGLWRRWRGDESGEIWITAGTADIATSRTLAERFGPLTHLAYDRQAQL